MTSLAPEPSVNAGDLVADLAKELSEIRRRGINAVDRDDRKQHVLDLPVIGSIHKGSQWASEDRPLAIRRILAGSVPYCRSAAARRAVPALFGLDTFDRESAGERRALGLGALRVPERASAEHKKERIREVREELARAILVASANDFRPPDPYADGLDDDAQNLPSFTQSVLDELRLLTTERGVTAAKIESQTPAILGLPSVREQYVRSSASDERADCAVEVLRCASRAQTMQGKHQGRLIAEMLNLGQTVRAYDQRVEAYCLAAGVSRREFTVLDGRAFRRYARFLVSLDRSPCQAEADNARLNREAAEHLAGLLSRLSTEDRIKIAQELLRLVEESIPGVARVIVEGPIGDSTSNVDRFLLRLDSLTSEYAEWVLQYANRIDENEFFLDFDLLENALVAALYRPARADMFDVRGLLSRHWAHRIERTLTEDEFRSAYGTYIESGVYQRQLASSVILLSQLLAFNEENDYWEKAAESKDSLAIRDAPLFPIIPISDFDHDRVRVDGTT